MHFLNIVVMYDLSPTENLAVYGEMFVLGFLFFVLLPK